MSHASAAPISDKQVAANRANAQHSTGPVTDGGKASAARNSYTHGLTSLTFSLLPHESAPGFEQLLTSFTEELKPAAGTETHLVLEIAQHFWLAQRAMNLEATAWNPDGTINDRRLSLAIRYLNTHERLGRECRAQLKQLQDARQKAERRAQAAAASPNGFVSHNRLSPEQQEVVARMKAQIDAEMDEPAFLSKAKTQSQMDREEAAAGHKHAGHPGPNGSGKA